MRSMRSFIIVAALSVFGLGAIQISQAVASEPFGWCSDLNFCVDHCNTYNAKVCWEPCNVSPACVERECLYYEGHGYAVISDCNESKCMDCN